MSRKEKLITIVEQEEKRLKAHIVPENSSISRILESVSLTGTRMPDLNIWIEIPITILSGGKSLLRHYDQNSKIRKAAKINNEMARKALLAMSDLKDLLLGDDLDAAIIALQKYTPPVFKAVRGSGALKPYWFLVDEE